MEARCSPWARRAIDRIVFVRELVSALRKKQPRKSGLLEPFFEEFEKRRAELAAESSRPRMRMPVPHSSSSPLIAAVEDGDDQIVLLSKCL